LTAGKFPATTPPTYKKGVRSETVAAVFVLQKKSQLILNKKKQHNGFIQRQG
jgi:hypothetical protein